MARATISAIYPNEPGSHFDAAYYCDRHTPFAISLLEPHGLVDIGAALGVENLDGGAPTFWAISEMIFETRERFDEAMAACGERLFADIANYTSVTPILQVSRPIDPNHS